MSELTPDQQIAADKFLEFMFDPELKYFAIEGIAGTGKSYLTTQLLTTYYDSYKDMVKMVDLPDPYTHLVVTATTNKAKCVIESMIPDTYDVLTIYAFIGLKVVINPKTGTTKVIPNKGNMSPANVHKNKGKGLVLVIDEASMVDSILLNYIDEYVPLAKKIFIGDPSQLLKVGSTSPAYKVVTQSSVLLETPIRNKGNPHLTNLYLQFHNTVNTQQYWDTLVVPGVIDHIQTTTELNTELVKLFGINADKSQKNQVLAYTNSTIIKYVGDIRDLELRSTDHWDKGEVVMTNGLTLASSVKTNTSRTKSPPSHRLSTDSPLEIVEHYKDVITGKDLISSIIDDGNPLFDTPLNINSYIVKELNNNSRTSMIYEIHPDSKEDLLKLTNYLTQNGMWTDLYRVKETLAILKSTVANTVHKSQGSTFHTVLIDLNDIGRECTNPDTLARLLYVAVSRATDRVIFYGNLPAKYGEILK